MTMIDYQQLQTLPKPKYFVSYEANQIAHEVINTMYVQQGYGLAPFLGLSDGVDNHKAVRIWVQGKLDKELACEVYQLINELTNLCSFECAFNHF